MVGDWDWVPVVAGAPVVVEVAPGAGAPSLVRGVAAGVFGLKMRSFILLPSARRIWMRLLFIRELSSMLLLGSFHSGGSPTVDAAAQFYYRVTFCGKDSCRLLAAVAAPAVKGNGLVLRKQFEGLSRELVVQDIDVEVRSGDEALCVLLGSANIEKGNIICLDIDSKCLGVDGFEGFLLLSASENAEKR